MTVNPLVASSNLASGVFLIHSCHQYTVDMEYYLNQLENSLEHDLPLLTLIGTFAVIDMIAALDSDDGITTSTKFIG